MFVDFVEVVWVGGLGYNIFDYMFSWSYCSGA